MVDNDALSLPSIIPEELHGYISWRHPTRSMQLYLREESVQMLSTRSLRQSKASNPSELGGLLWGKILCLEHGSSGLVLVPELVPSEALFFNTTENDSQRLVAALGHPPQSDLQLMGFFRSHLREGLCLSDQDEALISRYILDPDSVFLVIRPFEIGICMAGFFFWEHGRLQTDVSDLEVPFAIAEDGHSRHIAADSGQPASSLCDHPKWIPPAAGMAPATPPSQESGNDPLLKTPTLPDIRRQPLQKQTTPQASLATPLPSNRWRRSSWKFVLPSAVVLLACFGLYFAIMKLELRTPSPPTATAKTQVGLQVKVNSNGQMDLSWDQTSPDLQTAQGAKLTIIDGTLHRELNIDQGQLRFGRLAYFPNSDDVQFYLEIHLDPTRSIAESVRVLPKLARTPTVLQMTSAAPVRPKAENGFTSSSSRSLSSGGDKPVPPAQNSPSRLVQPASGARIFPTALAAAVTSPTALHPSTQEQISPPPSLDSTSSGTINSTPGIRLAAAPLPPPPQITSQQAARPSVRLAAPGPAYVPARPLKQVLPNPQFSAPIRILEVTSVTLQVEINEKGRVAGVHVIRGTSGANAILAAQAVAAAKQWKFEPATLHGKNVPSEHTIVFRFRPGE